MVSSLIDDVVDCCIALLLTPCSIVFSVPVTDTNLALFWTKLSLPSTRAICTLFWTVLLSPLVSIVSAEMSTSFKPIFVWEVNLASVGFKVFQTTVSLPNVVNPSRVAACGNAEPV